jgi:hypothetical protein
MSDFLDAIRTIGGTKFTSFGEADGSQTTGGLYWKIGEYADEVETNAKNVQSNTDKVKSNTDDVAIKHAFVLEVKDNLIGDSIDYLNPSTGSVYKDIITKHDEVSEWYTDLHNYSDQIITVGNDLASDSKILKVAGSIGNVDIVGLNLANESNSTINIVANDLQTVSNVAAISNDIKKVSLITKEITTVSNLDDEVKSIYTNKTQVEALGNDFLKNDVNSKLKVIYNNMSEINSLYLTFGNNPGNLDNINLIASDLNLDNDEDMTTHSNLNTVAYNIHKIQSVYNNTTSINTVSGLKEDIELITEGSNPLNGFTNIKSIQIVAEDLACTCGNSSYIAKVVNIDDEIVKVAGLETQILNLSNNSSGLTYLSSVAPSLVSVSDNLDALLNTNAGSNYAYDEYVYNNLDYDLVLEDLPIEINNSSITYDKDKSQVIIYFNRERLNNTAYTINTNEGTFSIIDPSTGNPFIVTAGSNLVIGIEVFDLIQLKDVISTSTMEEYKASIQEQILEMDKNTYKGFFPLAVGILDGFTVSSNSITLYPNIPNKYISAHINDMTDVLDLDNLPETLYQTEIGELS